MRRYYFSPLAFTLVLLLTCGAAQAQLTPEAVIGMIPPLPSQPDLVQAALAEREGKEVPTSVANFNMLVEKANQAIDEDASRQGAQQSAQAEAEIRRQTGMDLSELQGMSQAQARAMGERQAAEAMRGAGMAQSLQELQNMSPADQKNMAEQLARQMTGMSVAELQAMQGMSQEEQMARMRQAGTLDKLAAQRGAQPPMPQMDMGSLERINQSQAGMQSAQGKIRAFQDAVLAEDRALRDKISEIFKTKYEARLRANRREFEKWEGHKDKEAEVAAGLRKERELYAAYYNEVIPLWRDMCVSQRERAQALIPDGRSVDEFNAALTGQQGAGAPNQAFFMARMALGCQAKITSVPKAPSVYSNEG